MKEYRKFHSPIVKKALIIAGLIAVLLGTIGVFVPVLPTTPFLLLAAWCFGSSSDRFYHWLMNHRLWGKYLSDYTEGKGIPFRIKAGALTLLWAAILSSAYFAVENTLVRIILIVIALAVSTHILHIKTLRK